MEGRYTTVYFERCRLETGTSLSSLPPTPLNTMASTYERVVTHRQKLDGTRRAKETSTATQHGQQGLRILHVPPRDGEASTEPQWPFAALYGEALKEGQAPFPPGYDVEQTIRCQHAVGSWISPRNVFSALCIPDMYVCIRDIFQLDNISSSHAVYRSQGRSD